MESFFLHDTVKHRHIQGNDRNCRTRLSDETLVDRNICTDSIFFKFFTDLSCSLVQMFLCSADGTLKINGISEFRSDIRIGECNSVLFNGIGICEGPNPCLPVLSAHHLHRRFHFFLCGSLDGFLSNRVVFQIQILICKIFSCRL